MRYLLLVLILMTGCLRADPSKPAIESLYPTAELYVGEEPHLGVALVSIEKGSPFSCLGLSVRVYYEGTIRFFSERCGVDVTRVYTESTRLSVPLLGNVKHSCLVSVRVNPKYPTQEWHDQVVF